MNASKINPHHFRKAMQAQKNFMAFFLWSRLKTAKRRRRLRYWGRVFRKELCKTIEL